MRSLTLIQVLFLIAAAGMAQTPDGETPAQEEICAGLEGAAFGLCNAYCEAMDCDSDTPNASARACGRTRDRFLLATGGDDLPCVVRCPCEYTLNFNKWPAGEVQLFCQPELTVGATIVNGQPVPPSLGVIIDDRVRIGVCSQVNDQGLPKTHYGLTAQEAHACSVDTLAYLLALRAARTDIYFSGDDLDACEPIPLPE